MYASNSAKQNIRTAISSTSRDARPAAADRPTIAPPKVDARNLLDLLNKIDLTALTNIIRGINPDIRQFIDNALKQQIVVPFGGIPIGMRNMQYGVPVDRYGNRVGPPMPVPSPFGLRPVLSIPS